MSTVAPPELDRATRDLIHLVAADPAQTVCGLPVRNRLRTPDLRLITCPVCQESNASRPGEA